MICAICYETPDVPHDHHPTLQSVGGRDDGTIILCSNCHNSVHREINRICALYRNGKGGANSVNWVKCRHPQEIQIATNVILQGVKSVLTFDGSKNTLIGISVTPEVHQILRMLKDKTGSSNLPQVVIACIKYTAQHSGLV